MPAPPIVLRSKINIEKCSVPRYTPVPNQESQPQTMLRGGTDESPHERENFLSVSLILLVKVRAKLKGEETISKYR